ncbi:MAG: hypothetical protein WCF16_08980 [Alphaproteobacteria bacterium]
MSDATLAEPVQPVPESPIRAAPAGQGVALDRYLIQCDRRLPAFDTPTAAAFAAEDTKGARENLIALVTASKAPPRAELLPSLRTTDCPFLMRPYRWGAVDWPAAGERRFAIIYAQPGRNPVVPSLDGPYPDLSEAVLVDRVIKPVLSALADLAQRAMTHRAIRPNNLFFGYTEGQQAVLGDCAIAPAGSTSPVLFETIENGMAHPMGRGPGTIADDLYALGATLLCLALRSNPAAGIEDQKILYDKIEKGSYAALTGSKRVPQAIREVIRGLLADNPNERWTLENLALWVDGRRLSPIQPSIPPQSTRPFRCAGRQHYTCRSLAYTVGMSWSGFPKALEDTDLEGWVRKAVGDPVRANDVMEAFASGGVRIKGGEPLAAEATLASRLCMALDPEGPIRYKNVSTWITGLGPLLFDLIQDQSSVQAFAQLIASGLALHWIDKHHGNGPEGRAHVNLVDHLRQYLKRQAPGFGVERCLYELNPSLPCLSSLLASRYVLTPDELLIELERLAGSGKTDSLPVDRHVAAFIAARFGTGVQDHFLAMEDRSDKANVMLGALRALAVMQWKLGAAPLPGLTAWMGRLIGPVIGAYHSATLRAKLGDQIARVVKRGNLSELLNLVDDAQVRARDDQSYRAAARQHRIMGSELDRITGKSGLDKEAAALGGKLAAGLGMAAAAGASAIVGMMRFL